MMAKLQLLVLLASLNVTCLIATPEFHNVLKNSPDMYSYLLSNQIQMESEVKDGVLYERQHPDGQAEKGFSQVLQETLKKYDSRFSEPGVSAYWTFQIRIAREQPGSKWHSYAKSLPLGIQTIKRRVPKLWFEERVMNWNPVWERKVIVY